MYILLAVEPKLHTAWLAASPKNFELFSAGHYVIRREALKRSCMLNWRRWGQGCLEVVEEDRSIVLFAHKGQLFGVSIDAHQFDYTVRTLVHANQGARRNLGGDLGFMEAIAWDVVSIAGLKAKAMCFDYRFTQLSFTQGIRRLLKVAIPFIDHFVHRVARSRSIGNGRADVLNVSQRADQYSAAHMRIVQVNASGHSRDLAYAVGPEMQAPLLNVRAFEQHDVEAMRMLEAFGGLLVDPGFQGVLDESI